MRDLKLLEGNVITLLAKLKKKTRLRLSQNSLWMLSCFIVDNILRFILQSTLRQNGGAINSVVTKYQVSFRYFPLNLRRKISLV